MVWPCPAPAVVTPAVPLPGKPSRRFLTWVCLLGKSRAAGSARAQRSAGAAGISHPRRRGRLWWRGFSWKGWEGGASAWLGASEPSPPGRSCWAACAPGGLGDPHPPCAAAVSQRARGASSVLGRLLGSPATGAAGARGPLWEHSWDGAGSHGRSARGGTNAGLLPWQRRGGWTGKMGPCPHQPRLSWTPVGPALSVGKVRGRASSALEREQRCGDNAWYQPSQVGGEQQAARRGGDGVLGAGGEAQPGSALCSPL